MLWTLAKRDSNCCRFCHKPVQEFDASPRIRSGKVSLRVGPQIQTAGLTAADRETLLREVRAAVERLLDQGEAGDPPASSARDRPFPATMS